LAIDASAARHQYRGLIRVQRREQAAGLGGRKAVDTPRFRRISGADVQAALDVVKLGPVGT
jgi:hypothetical protein